MSALTKTLETENVVASTSIDQELDLESLADDIDSVRYDPDQFPGLVYRTHNPKAAALLFRSGKLVCTGANSEEDVTGAINQTFDTLHELGIDVPEKPEVTIQNVVTSGDLGEKLNLNAIAIGFGLKNIEYEPEQFPGLVYRPEELDVVVLLFGSGKLVITGGKSGKDAEEAIEIVAERLEALNLL